VNLSQGGIRTKSSSEKFLARVKLTTKRKNKLIMKIVKALVVMAAAAGFAAASSCGSLSGSGSGSGSAAAPTPTVPSVVVPSGK